MTQQASGIYGIRSISHPERVYIGSAVNIPRRWRQHRSRLALGVHHSPKLQSHYNKYGPNDLVFEFIIKSDKESLIRAEQIFIDSYNPWFNISMVAGNCSGTRRSAETRAKIAENSRGNKNMLGKKISEEAKERMSEAHKGKKLGKDNPFYGKRHPKDVQEKINAANRGRTPWNKGKTGIFSSETLEKIREGARGNHNRKGAHHSEETREKISECRRGSHASGETKAKMARAAKGRRHSEESKAKMSESAIKREQAKRLAKQKQIPNEANN